MAGRRVNVARLIPRRWPLILIGGAAGISTWSGWVGLGSLTGFGVIRPLPGIADEVSLNTAITLPIGVEAYAVYALAVATGTDPLTERARHYAWASAAGALGLGMLGQIAYHVMNAAGVTAAPWQVVALVSCLPVLVLGAASLLWHLAGEAAVVEIATVAAPEPEADVATTGEIPLPREPEAPTDVAPEDATEAEPAAAKPATDAELAAVIAGVLAKKPKAGRPTIVKALKDAGYSPGNGKRLTDAIAAHKRGGLHAVPTSAAL
jgi:hypothetical protein